MIGLDPKQGGAVKDWLDVPHSELTREVEEILHTRMPSFLANHSFRSHAWATSLGRVGRVGFDREVLYVAALLHDIGLVPSFDSGGCFEDDGAYAALGLASRAGWSADKRQRLAYAIRLHVAPEEPPTEVPEAYLLWYATGLDVTGERYEDVPVEAIREVLGRYPRDGFEDGFVGLLRDQDRRKTGCWASVALERGIADRIKAAPFPS